MAWFVLPNLKFTSVFWWVICQINARQIFPLYGIYVYITCHVLAIGRVEGWGKWPMHTYLSSTLAIGRDSIAIGRARGNANAIGKRTFANKDTKFYLDCPTFSHLTIPLCLCLYHFHTKIIVTRTHIHSYTWISLPTILCSILCVYTCTCTYIVRKDVAMYILISCDPVLQ